MVKLCLNSETNVTISTVNLKRITASRVAIDNARLSIANGQLDVTETWIKLGEYCNRKISECREQLEDLEVALNRMEERDLA